MSMTPIDEEGSERDLESGPDLGSQCSPSRSRSPSPTHEIEGHPPVPPRRIITDSGQTVALSKKLGSTSSARSQIGPPSRISFSSVGDVDTCSEVSSPSMTPVTPATIVTNAGKTLAVSRSGKHLTGSSKSLRVSASSRSLGFSGSVKSVDLGMRSDIGQKKMYVKQVTGRHNDTELHLAAQRGDLDAVRRILEEIEEQVTGITSEVDMQAELLQIRTAIVNELNELGETAFLIAAEKGHLEVLKVLLPYMTREGIVAKNRSGLDAFHAAATQGHIDIVKVLLDYDRGLCKTFGQSNATPLISAATRGHTAVVRILLEKNSSLIDFSKNNGKNALHFSVRQGHVDITEALLNVDPQLARKTDKKEQTALHMAVKGHSSEVVRLLLRADPTIVMIPDKFGNTALHIATRKKRVEIVKELLFLPETDINALSKARKTPLDVIDDLAFSEETAELKDILIQSGALRACELLNQPKDEIRQTVTEIQKKVHSQLEQARRTNRNMHGIAKDLKKLHREGINNATQSVTVVAVLFATVAFAALFTVPGGYYNDGLAVMVNRNTFKIFFIANAVSLFTSLSVVVVQMTLVRGETKTERRVVEVINKLMWIAAICTTVAFMSSSFIIIGKHHKWAAILVTVLGGVVMGGVLGTMTICVVRHKKSRKVKKKNKSSKNGPQASQDDISELEVNAIFAI